MKGIKIKLNILFFFLLLSSATSIAGAYRVVAYMPSYRMTNLENLNFKLYTHIMASFANPDINGDMFFQTDIDDFVTTVHANNRKAVISIGGGGNYSWGAEVAIYEELFKTKQSRTAFIHKIMNYLRAHKLDGLDNDIEGNALALANFNLFAMELGDSLKTQDLEYSAAIGVGGFWGEKYWDDFALDKLDFIMTMSYGGVGDWNWSTKKDEHTYEKMVSDIDYLKNNRGIHRSKIVGGIPFYSVEFPSSAQSGYGNFHKSICDIYKNRDYEDPFHKDTLTSIDGHPVYINSIETIQRKINYGAKFGGIMIWEAGQDCFDGPISLQDSIHAYMVANSVNKKEVLPIEFTVSPTLADDHININIPTPQKGFYSIYNSIGSLVIKGEFKNNFTVNTSNLSSGNYFLRLNNELNQFKQVEFIKK